MLTGHTREARRRRPVEPRVDRSSTSRRAQVRCVVALSKDRVVSGSWDETLKVWGVSSGRCLCTLRGHTDWARRRRPVKQSVRAIRGAGPVCRRAVEQPRRVRVVRPHAQGVEQVDRSVPRDADRAHGLGAAPRPVEPQVDCSSTPRGAQVNCVAVLSNGRVVSGSDDRTLKVWKVSSGQCLGTLTGHTDLARRRVQSNRKSIAPRRREGRRSIASPSCRTAASCPGRTTARSRCGTRRAVSVSGR